MARCPRRLAVACRAMRAAGLASVNPSSPELAALIDAGATADALADAAARAVDGQRALPTRWAWCAPDGRCGPRGGRRGWRGVGAAGLRQPARSPHGVPAAPAHVAVAVPRHRREKSGDTAKTFIETGAETCHLPLPWVDQFSRADAGCTARRFTARWRDLDLDAGEGRLERA